MLENNTLAALSRQAPKAVHQAIQTASDKIGVDFSYMLSQAKAESSFRPDIKAKTSSASGLYQFIESTWMRMVDKYGEQFGIEVDGKSRTDILEMRNDPEKASFMAAALAKENEKFLSAHYEGDIGSTELYFAHFMGASGAAGFLNARAEDPMQGAAILFPKAAKANRNVFYDPDTGKSRTLEDVYAFFDKKFISDNSLQEMPQEQQNTRIASKAVIKPAISSSVFTRTAHMNNFMSSMQNSALGGRYQDLVKYPMELLLLTQTDLVYSPAREHDENAQG